ncbi:hypothetical protein [Clostridium botulinum]|uniref:hypothetical protein n=1 Tax=Clostridium botulinum TaxID=1491 RepID=UPI00174ACABC|nr:hypothetical protein [Clostridium botulinum]MBD5589318.1 hypothetical protein [Clostridium botulinum]
MENKQELRQANNSITITGVLKESKLKAGKNEEGNYINGSLVIKAGEFTDLTVNIFQKEKTSKGETSNKYLKLKQILDKEQKTMADGISEEEATKVRIWGSDTFTCRFGESFYEKDGEPKANERIELGFGNITFDDKVKAEDYKAAFDVEMYVSKVEDETKMENGIPVPTGRVLITGWTPVFGGLVIPMKVVAGIVKDDKGNECNFGEQLKANLYEGITFNVWGDIDYKEIITKVKKGGGLGIAKVEDKKKYVHDLVGKGGDLVTDPEKAYQSEAIRDAIAERKIKQDEDIRKQQEKKGNKGKGFGLSGTADTQPVNGDEDDCPF